jgi:hypothetical protein
MTNQTSLTQGFRRACNMSQFPGFPNDLGFAPGLGDSGRFRRAKRRADMGRKARFGPRNDLETENIGKYGAIRANGYLAWSGIVTSLRSP